MVKTAVKRKISGQQDDHLETEGKKACKEMTVSGGNCEDIVGEFLKLTAVKQTRLKGFKQFLTTLKTAKTKHDIVTKYLQSRPDCAEIFQVLNKDPEQRSSLELQIVIEILEVIILQLTKDDMKNRSQATAIISRLLMNHRKPVSNSLNPASPANLTMAVLKLLTAIVMHGPTLAKELLTTFDFSHKTFTALVNRRNKRDDVDIRTCFIKFVLSFFIAGDPALITQVLKIKDFATSILKNLHNDSAEVIHLILAALISKVVQNHSILKKTKIRLFTSYSLSQLAKLYSYEDDDASMRERIHQFLLELCTSENGIAFENQLGIFSKGSNNPVLLRFLQSLPKHLNDDLLTELIIRTLLNSPDLISPYLSGYQMVLEPRQSQQWINNFHLLMKLYLLLPIPSSYFSKSSVSPDRIPNSRLLSLVCPENVKRNILTRGLQHADATVQGTTLCMMAIVLRRSCNMVHSTKIDCKILTSFREDVLKLLPSFQTLISIRENLCGRTGEALAGEAEKLNGHSPQLSMKDARILLSRTVNCMALFQILSPNCFILSKYDPWKLLPRNVQEESLYNPSSKTSMLRMFLRCPSRNFKSHLQPKAGSSTYFHQILRLFCNEKDSTITSMAKELVVRILMEIGICNENEEEISIWLYSIHDGCIEASEVVMNFFEKVYSSLASDPFVFVDDVIELVIGATLESRVVSSMFEHERSLPFTPMVVSALKLFAAMAKNIDIPNIETKNLDILARYLNLVLLNILELQTDPRPLCSVIVKTLAQDDVTSLPVHTRLLLDYVTRWSTEVNEGDLGITGRNEKKFLKKFKQLQKDENAGRILTLPLALVKKQIHSSIHCGKPLDLPFFVNYLKCNPVFLFDSENPTDVIKALSGLPCFIILRQLLMFVFKAWESGTEIRDGTGLWDTFQELQSAILLSAKRGPIESWERTISATLFLASNVVQLYLENSRNELLFLEILRTIIEVLRTVFDQVREMSTSCGEKMDGLNDVIHDDVTNDDITNDVTNDVLHGNVMTAVDRICDVPYKKHEKDANVFLRLMKMVLEHDVFTTWFCHVRLDTERDGTGLVYVSKIMSDCVAEILKQLHAEILQENDCGFLEPYFTRIARALKDEVFGVEDLDVKLPYNISVTSLLKLFHKYFPVRSLNEILEAFLETPKEHFVEVTDGNKKETALNRNCETFIAVMECVLDRGDELGEYDALSSNGLRRVFETLLWLNCEKSDEIIAKFARTFLEFPDAVLSAVLQHFLDQPSCVRVQTAVLVLCQSPALLTQLEEWVLTRRKEKHKKSLSCKGVTFLGNESEWSTFLPLLLYYVSRVKTEETATHTKQTGKCLKYICEVTWLRLKEWLLEMKFGEKSNECLKMLCLLLDVEETDQYFVQTLFSDTVVREWFVKLNLYRIEAVENILQCILKHSLKDKEQRKYRSIFVFACMQRLSEMMKNQPVEDSLRMKILQYLEIYGQKSLRFKNIEAFSVEDFVTATNTFLKSALRFYFTCSQTLHVLSVLIKSIYESCSSQLLLPLNDVYKFILSHSKFLNVLLGTSDCDDKCSDNKEALVDLLQTVVGLEPSCCEPSHLFLILGAYSAKLSLTDQKLLRLLFTYETHIDGLDLGSRVSWGEAAIQAYEAEKSGPVTLWHEPNITQILDLLDSKLLLQSAKHFPRLKSLQPVDCEDFGADSQYYDPSFFLPLFSFFLTPGCEVNCRRFIDSSALAYTISALTSVNEEMRRVAYQVLSRFQNHLSTARFREKHQVSHLLHCFQNGITKVNSRVSSLVASFMARALHIFFYPEDPMYPSVNSYMLQRAFMDMRDVPLFLSLLNNSDLTYRTQRLWLLHLILDGLRGPMDYFICKKFHVFQQLCALYNSAIADKSLQNLILKILHGVCRFRAAVYDLCQNCGLVPWLHLLITGQVSDNFQQVLDILARLWFTLVGQDKLRVGEDTRTANPASLPKNIVSELLLVLSSILQSRTSVELWNEDVFLSYTSLLASVLNYQVGKTTAYKVISTQEDFIHVSRIWLHLFGAIDISSKMEALVKTNKDLPGSKSKISSEKWSVCLKYVLEIFASCEVGETTVRNIEEQDEMYFFLSQLNAEYFELFLRRKLCSSVQIFRTISERTLLPKDCQKLLFLNKIVQ